MKTFRCPFWKANTSRLYIRFTIIVAILMTPLLYILTYSLWACVILLLFWSIVCFPIYFTQYFYVILTDDQIILKNSIYTFWNKQYFFKDIVKIEIMPSINVYIKVFTKKSNKFLWAYVIDLVAPEDYDEMIGMIRAKGITVETAGLDIHFPNRNSRKVSKTENCYNSDIKIFRQSLFNTSLLKINFTFTAIITTLLAPVVLVTTQSVWACLGVILFGYSLFFIYFTRHFYVMLLADKLVIRNGVYSFLRKEYFYKDIAEVKIEQGRNIYMQVSTKRQEESSKRYIIDMVPAKDYKQLVEMIRAKGIKVETEGLDIK